MSEAENVDVQVRNVEGVAKEKETREKLSEDMKDYAKSTMNELLGMFGYEKDVSQEAVDELNLKEIPMEEGGDSPEKSEEVPDEYDDDDGALPSMVATTSRITSSENVESEATVVALPDGKGNAKSVGMEEAQEHRSAEVVIPSAATESIENPAAQAAAGTESNSTTTTGNKQEPERATPVFAHPATNTINGMYCVIAHMPCIESKGKTSVTLKFWNCILCSNYFLQKPEIVFRVEQPYLFIHQPQWLYQAALCQSCCRILKPAGQGGHQGLPIRNQNNEMRIDGPVDSILQANAGARTDQGGHHVFQSRNQTTETRIDGPVDSILQANARLKTDQGGHHVFQNRRQSAEIRVDGPVNSILQGDKRFRASPATAEQNYSSKMKVTSKHNSSVEVRRPKFILPKPACSTSVTNVSMSSCEDFVAKENVSVVCSFATSASVVRQNDRLGTSSVCSDSLNNREGLCSEESEINKIHFQCRICSRHFNKASKQCGLSKAKFPNLFSLSFKEMDRIKVCVKCFSRLNRQRDRFEAAGIPEGSRNYFAYIKLWTGNEMMNLAVKKETSGAKCFICEQGLVDSFEFVRSLQRWKYPSLLSRLKENANVCNSCYKKIHTLRMKFEKASVEEDKRQYAEFINSWRKQKGLDRLNI